MVLEGVKGLSMGSSMAFTGTAEHVINVLFDVVSQVLACKASLIDTVVNPGEVMECWSSFVGVLCYLEVVSDGYGLHRGLNCFPINVIKCVIGPIHRNKLVSFLGVLHVVFALAWSGSRCLDIFIFILGYKSPIVKQGCFCAGDPVREASNITRAFVVGFGTHIISATISQGRDWKFVAWFVAFLVSLHPLHHHWKQKFIDDLKDTVKDVVVSLEEVKDRCIHVIEGPFEIIVRQIRRLGSIASCKRGISHTGYIFEGEKCCNTFLGK